MADMKEKTGDEGQAAAKADMPPADTGKKPTDEKDDTKEQTAAAKANMERALGEVLLFLAGHPAFEYLFLNEMEDGILHPVMLRQFRLIHNEEGIPLAYVSWAMMNEESMHRIKDSGKIVREDWNSGKQPVIMDAVAPNAEMAERAAEKVRREVLKTESVMTLRPLPEGGIELANFAPPKADSGE